MTRLFGKSPISWLKTGWLHECRPSRRSEAALTGQPAFIRWSCLLFAGAIAGGCGENAALIACTAEARFSIQLAVLDEANQPLTDIDVTYERNGGPPQSARCASADFCSNRPVELDGTFRITVGKVGYASNSASVTVTRDACHVTTAGVTIVLRRMG